MFPKAVKTFQILSSSDNPVPTLVPNKPVVSPFPIHSQKCLSNVCHIVFQFFVVTDKLLVEYMLLICCWKDIGDEGYT